MQIFARITKIDEATRRVYGVASSEAVDHAGESLDYDLSKQYFQDWSNGVSKATDGKSVGNLRVMHGNVVAGKLVELQCEDVTKSFPVCAEVVDDNEWNKTLKGCYTGFSIGGSYVSKSPKNADGVVKYVAKPNELSLVDLPCNPDATFIVSKADGIEELRKFAPEADRLAKARADLAARIHKNAKAEPVARALSDLLGKPLEKGMYSVSQLADLLSSLGWLADDAEWEASWEGDGSTVPADLRAAVKTLAGILVRMATEESQELAESLGAGTEKVTPPGDLNKSATSPEEDAMNDELQKSLTTAQADLVKVSGERDDLKKALDTAATEIAERDELLMKAAAALDERNAIIAKFQNAPAPVRAALMAVAKGDDVGGVVAEVDQVKKADGTVDEAATAIKKALMTPVFTR
jgi:hypothetical protein